MAASQVLTARNKVETVAKRKTLVKEFRALSPRMGKSRLEMMRLADSVFEQGLRPF